MDKNIEAWRKSGRYLLWHMARHGYVLRKTNMRGKFDDIDETTTAANEKATAAMARAMGLTPLA